MTVNDFNTYTMVTSLISFFIILSDADGIPCAQYAARAELKVTGSFVQIFFPLETTTHETNNKCYIVWHKKGMMYINFWKLNTDGKNTLENIIYFRECEQRKNPLCVSQCKYSSDCLFSPTCIQANQCLACCFNLSSPPSSILTICITSCP